MPGAKHTPKNDAMIAEYKAGASIKVIAQNHGVSSKRVLAVMKALAPEVSTSERRMGLPDTSIAGQRFGRLIALAPSRSIGSSSFEVEQSPKRGAGRITLEG